MSWFGDILEGFSPKAGEAARSGVVDSLQKVAEGARRSFARATGWSFMSSNGYGNLAAHLEIERDLMSRYVDYEEMDDYPPLATALDIYADEATQDDVLRNKPMWVVSEDEGVREELNDLLFKRLKVDEDLWGNARTISHYGNNFAEIIVHKDHGVVGLEYMDPPDVRRMEDARGTLMGYIQQPSVGNAASSPEQFASLLNDDGSLTSEAMKIRDSYTRQTESPPTAIGFIPFESWEVVHWRLRGKRLRSPYGYSVLEPARWVWKRLILLEDAALLHKLTRAPSKWGFYVDVGEMAPDEALAYVKEVKSGFRKKKFVNSRGQLDFKVNPLCVALDTRIPQLDGTERTIEEMIAAHERGEEQWVYSVDRRGGGRFVPGKVAWAGRTRKAAQMVRVTLDNGESIRTTPDHKWIRRDGEYVEAKDLTPGAELMSMAQGERSVSLVEVLEETEDTGTLTIEKWANFGTSAGVYIKNSVDEDFWVPSRGGKDSTRIEALAGPDYQAVDDMRYFREYILAAIKIPGTYLGMTDGGADAGGTLSSRDVRFAKSVMRVQRALAAGYKHVCRVHLAVLGYDPDEIEWDIVTASPSSIFELAQIEVRNAQADLAQRMEPYVDRLWSMRNIFDFSDDEAEEILKRQDAEAEQTAVRGAKIQVKVAKLTGQEPAEVDVAAMTGQQGAAPAAGAPPPETSDEVGTGNTAPNPKKGTPAESFAESLAKLKSLLS